MILRHSYDTSDRNICYNHATFREIKVNFSQAQVFIAFICWARA